MEDERKVSIVSVGEKERGIERKAKEANSLASTLKDEDDTHVGINMKIAEKYPLNSQNALFRHAIKKLLDKAGITDDEFTAFNAYCDSVVAESKKGGN
ncbi:MAG: hypothetical protein LKG11_00650 [Bacilli bacterium]|jgi:hypothetical protein|nr:hypothetical protein [Bacilli bacterium]